MTAKLLVPNLPVEHDGESIEWRPWEEAAVALCGRSADVSTCGSCGSPGPRLLALGVAGSPPVVRVYGHRCPDCQETRAYWRTDPPKGAWQGRLELIAYSAPRTITTASEAPADAVSALFLWPVN